MPTLRQRASSASAETRGMFGNIAAQMGSNFSWLYDRTEPLRERGPHPYKPRVAVVASADPVDVALGMQTSPRLGYPKAVAVLNTANEKKAGGLWEGAVFAAEEALARRSNLVQTLTTGEDGQPAAHYPIPERGGLFSPTVAVIRGGPEQNYELWDQKDWRSVSVISVAPVRRPKLDESGYAYSFPQERELQMEKMRTVLRLAVYHDISDVCLGAFGSGSFRNPMEEVCQMWKELLLGNGSEFEGWFKNVLFAVADAKGERNWEIFMRHFG